MNKPTHTPPTDCREASRPLEIDDDLIEIDPHVTGTNSRRSDRELNRMLDLIDSLPISDSGKDGSH